MKKLVIIFSSVFLLLFAAVALLKLQRAEQVTGDSAGGLGAIEKEHIQQFWQHYRGATKHRIAGELTAAIDAYSQALTLNEKHEDTLYYLGNMYWELGNYRAAESAWKRLVQVNPDSPRGHLRLGDLYLCFENKALFNIAAAEREYERAFKINREETGSLLRLGQLALIRGRLGEAQGYFEAVLGTNDRSLEAQYLSGYIAWKHRFLVAAATRLGLAVQYSQTADTSRGNLGEGATKSGRPLTVSSRSDCRIFSRYLADLAQLQPPIPADLVERSYQDLDALLQRIRKQAES
ncbi:MAG: tetratricopeptide repeat protein [Candidatus Marinimicrobia bacterium]|nr:tetratricopeptide repeat protein [Candidatus Neomarinimicrobiota bacterium]